MVETRRYALGHAALSTDEEEKFRSLPSVPSTYNLTSIAVYSIVGEAFGPDHVPRHGVEVSARNPGAQVH